MLALSCLMERGCFIPSEKSSIRQWVGAIAENSRGMTSTQQIVPEVPLQRLYKTLRSLRRCKTRSFSMRPSELLSPRGLKGPEVNLLSALFLEKCPADAVLQQRKRRLSILTTRIQRVQQEPESSQMLLIQTLGNHDSL